MAHHRLEVARSVRRGPASTCNRPAASTGVYHSEAIERRDQVVMRRAPENLIRCECLSQAAFGLIDLTCDQPRLAYIIFQPGGLRVLLAETRYKYRWCPGVKSHRLRVTST
jgi:hypothetical protein